MLHHDSGEANGSVATFQFPAADLLRISMFGLRTCAAGLIACLVSVCHHAEGAVNRVCPDRGLLTVL